MDFSQKKALVNPTYHNGAALVINIATRTPNGGARFGAEFDDIVYGAYVQERDIMEIPASGRLFMGHRHVARIAGERSVSLSSVAWHTGRMTVPQGRLLQDDPSPSSRTPPPWSPMVIVSKAVLWFRLSVL